MIFAAVSLHKKHQGISASMQKLFCYARQWSFQATWPFWRFRHAEGMCAGVYFLLIDW